ncbi:unnamed protein product, partial [marine sediment metagenome]
AVELDYPIANGVIHLVSIEFEKWCANLLHIQILRFRRLIFPSTPGASFAADGETIAWDDYFEVFETPYTLTIVGWNDDDFFDWTARIRVGVLPRTIAEHVYGKLKAADRRMLYEAFGLEYPGV